MGKIRISVTEIDTETGDEVVIIDLTAERELLRQFGPSAVASALDTSVPVGNETPAFEPKAEGEGGNYGPGQPARRKRRTKAEMEAARAQEQANDEPEAPVTQIRLPDPEPEAAAYNPFG